MLKKTLPTFMLLVLFTFSSYAINLGGLKLPKKSTSSSSASSPYEKLPAYGMAPEKLADQIDAYIKQKFSGESGMYKTSLDSMIQHMSAQYGKPTKINGDIAEWILHAQGKDCTQMKFIFDGRFVNVIRGVGICTMIE